MKIKDIFKDGPGFNPIPATKFMLLAALAILALIFALPSVNVVFGAERKLPIYSVETQEKVVAITFDAAWGASDTDILLEILKEHNARATFFICGYWVEEFSDDVVKFYKAGHDIANHGDKHAHVAQLNYDQNVAEVAGAHQKVKNLLGLDMDLYRPPYGEYNNTVISAAESQGYYVIQWDVDSLDWKKLGADHMVKTVLDHKNLQNGSILLFHNDLAETPVALRRILSELRGRGYSFVPVSELIYRENYKLDHAGRQIPLDGVQPQ
ncbi:MAG: polysaccharide deacetylase family protein [Defluviitaleaceae bacterium]|nr:polysaccharide deacetylase family protein [Defluviitaleaceae bacterium]